MINMNSTCCNYKYYNSWSDYPRFRHDAVKILLVSIRHLLVHEIRMAIERLGHSCGVMFINGEELDRYRVEQMYKESIKSFRPDFVLTVNHLGFDREGIITAMLTQSKIPFASWYVDSPYLILRHFEENRSPYLTLFLWDRDYIEIVRRLGFENVEYLPLGVDDTLFRPITTSKNTRLSPQWDVSFVGNSMVLKTRSIFARCGIDGPLKEHFDEIAGVFERSRHLVVRDMLMDRFPGLISEFDRLSELGALDYETSVTWRATGGYRARLIKNLYRFAPLIVGDRGWNELLDNRFILHSELNYYSELPVLYNMTRINFNATSRQMKQGVNQRVFDVPACRRVLITDWTEQLEDLMEPGRDVIAYKDGDEIQDLLMRMTEDKEFYNNVAHDGYRRVLNEHTYCHRMERLVAIMKKNYA